MAEPLDYFNPNAPDGPNPPKRTEPVRPIAMPAEFDALLTRTKDRAAARAVEAALRRGRIDVFTVERGAEVAIELHVRRADQARAEQIAGRIFARRRKIKSFPRPELPPVFDDDDEN
jgi:hypothetical protein